MVRIFSKTLFYNLLVTLIFGFNCLAAEPPFVLPQKSDLLKFKSAIIYTDKGEIEFDLFPEDAPWHVANFKYLADKGFYKRLLFHLHINNYIIQGGDPSGKGNGNPGYSLQGEFNQHKHEAGTLGMARLPDAVNAERRSNGSQFYITLGRAPHMDGLYTVFGEVKNNKSMQILDSLRQGDRIRDIKVFIRNHKNT